MTDKQPPDVTAIAARVVTAVAALNDDADRFIVTREELAAIVTIVTREISRAEIAAVDADKIGVLVERLRRWAGPLDDCGSDDCRDCCDTRLFHEAADALDEGRAEIVRLTSLNRADREVLDATRADWETAHAALRSLVEQHALALAHIGDLEGQIDSAQASLQEIHDFVLSWRRADPHGKNATLQRLCDVLGVELVEPQETA